jgi:hypothetical protein
MEMLACLLETPYTELSVLEMRYTDLSGVVDHPVLQRVRAKGVYAAEDQGS